MATKKGKAGKYRALLVAAGVWNDAFESALNDLCVLETRKDRVRKAWYDTAEMDEKGKRKAPDVLDPLHDKLLALEKEVARQKNALGLTPQGMQRLKKQQLHPENDPPPTSGNSQFAALMDGIKGMTHGSEA